MSDAESMDHARAPRAWLTRRKGECAFPVDGQGLSVRACCNPCGGDLYCAAHRRLMRRTDVTGAEDFARDTMAWLEERR